MPKLVLPKVDLRGMPLPALTEALAALGEPAFRAKQLYTWIHRRYARSFADMTDLSKVLRAKLEEGYQLGSLTKDLEQRSVDGTIKYRWKTADGEAIESVYMPNADRQTLCVSTQVGCAMGCKFCMTATLGLKRQLTPGEICDQVYAVNAELRAAGSKVERPLTNLVFMGMGEPLHNFENVKTSLQLLESPEGCNFSHRHITVSTVGLVPMIERFGAETDVKLAISLNATTDEQRSAVMPVNKKWPIAALMEACKKFPLRQGRRITFEYVLLKDVNDTDADALRLSKLMQDVPAKVNLIPYNDNPGLGFHSVGETRAEAFREILATHNVFAAIRKNRGRDIAAACGQLANVDAKRPTEAQTLAVLDEL
jgi:23S rRNA (adenine2503-C2)-methyltransferase